MQAQLTKVAIIGIGCWYPGAPNPQRLWENVLARRRQFRLMPDVRLPLAEYHDADRAAPDKTYGAMAAVLDGYDFDWSKHRIPKSAYDATDIAHWLALDVALQMLRDAGYSADRLPSSTTQVVVGNTLTGEFTRSNTLRLRWPYVEKALRESARRLGFDGSASERLSNEMEREFKSAFPPVTEDSLAGGLANTIAGRICNYLNVNGGGYTVDGACSSSLIAIYSGATHLANGSADFVIAGGVDVSLDPFELVGFAKTGALTPTRMSVYDKQGNGFIPGEGCGFVGMKRLSDARRDGDKVYAVLDGWGMSSDGKGGITAPSVHGQSLALQRAYERAGVAASQLDFIEGHGTGTAVGDRTELLGIAKALGAPATNGKRRCGVTSFKSVVGHTKAAAGIGAFIKAVVAVNQRVLPPTAGCTRPHDVFSGEARALFPILRGSVLPPDRELRAGVSAMGFGGINVHVTLASGDAPVPSLKPVVSERAALASAQDFEVFCLSAESEQELAARLTELRDDARGASLAELLDLSAGLNTRSDARQLFRASVVASSPAELIEKLEYLEGLLAKERLEYGEVTVDPARLTTLGHGPARARLGFVFPGQGSQQLNMARPLVERFEWARALVAEADRWSAELGTEGLSTTIYTDADRMLDPGELEPAADKLRDTRWSQPAIVLASLLWLKYLERLGIDAQAVLGHSLGELTAFFAAGAFDEKTLLQLATRRGQLMAAGDGNPAGGMASLACDQALAESVIAEVGSQGVLVVANLNSSSQTVVSGDARSIERLLEVARERGVRAQSLRVSNAFHSPLIASAAAGIREFAPPAPRSTQLTKSLISSCDGKLVSQDVDLREHFSRQVVTPVDFVAAIATLRAQTDWSIEVGPGRVLSGLIEQAAPAGRTVALRTESSAESFRDLAWVVGIAHAHGTSIRWEELYAERVVRPFEPARRLHFIVNPCERTQRSAALTQASETPSLTAKPAAPRANRGNGEAPNGFAILAREAARLTGFELSSMRPELRPLDDLNLDSIKVASLIGEACLALGVEPPENPAAFGSVSLGEIALRLTNGQANESAATHDADTTMAASDAALPTRQDQARISVEGLLLDLAARHTGFDRGTLDANASLTDDLNLDSIKIAALLSEAEATLGLGAVLEPATIADSTIGQIAARLEAHRTATPGPASAPRPARDRSIEPARDTKLSETREGAVRSFAMRLAPSRRETREAWRYAGQVIAIQCDADERPLAVALSSRLTGLGAKVVIQDPSELSSTLRRDIERLIVLLPRCVSSSSNEGALVAASVRRLRASAVVSARQRRCESLTFVQFGGLGYTTSGSFSSFATASASAFAASIHLERPALLVRVLDLHPGQDPLAVTRCVLSEQSGSEAYVLSHYGRDLVRHEQDAVVLQPELEPARGTTWGNRDVVLVTGGAKGITAECAIAFAQATKARLLLVGSSPAPDADSSSEIVRTLSRCKASGVFARYYQCDIVDREALTQLVAHVRREYGAITAVVHGAGLNRPRRVEQVEEPAAIAEVAPKLVGLLNLCESLRTSPPKLFVGMSSIIGITGMPGNAWYAFSNEAANACLARFKAFHPDTAVVSLAYSVWSDVGMGAKMGSDKQLAKMGVSALSPERGVASFLDATLRRARALQVVVAGELGGLDTWRAPAPPVELSGRFLENVVTFQPGVEVVARTRLTLDDDPYLRDHYFRGVYLFPTVFGLEAMAQAVAKVAAVNGFKSLKIVDVGLTRPIIVSSANGAEIQVKARVVMRGGNGEPCRVQVGIGVDQTAFKRDHFSATFLLEPQHPRDQVARESGQIALDLDPKRDLYGRLLFQGPMFQTLERVLNMDATGSSCGARHVRASHYFAKTHDQTLLLGDPLLRDALLQTAQLSTRSTVLPIGIDELDLYDLSWSEAPSVMILNKVVARSEVGPTCDVLAQGSTGKPLERLVGYRLKQMDRDESGPEPGDWANPTQRDSATLRSVLAKHCQRFGLAAPHWSLTFVPHLSEQGRAERRLLEAPLLLAVGQVASPRSPALEVGWREDGKPLFVGMSTDELDVALSHDDSYCLCVAGLGAQGCDLESIEPRSREGWLRLIGAEHDQLLEQLIALGEPLDDAGTRLWCTLETLTKAGQGRRIAKLEKQDEGVLFTPQEPGVVRVLTFSVSLTRLPKRVAALLLRPAAPSPSPSPGTSSRRSVARAPELLQRFRSTFKDTAGARGGVKPAIFADWMGTIRELSVASVANELISDFASGRWGMVTNYSNVRILRDIACLEEIEARLRFTRAYGKFGSSIDLHFDWSRVGADGSLQEVARADMGTTWVEIVGHGVVEVRPFPDYMDRLVKSYLPEPSVIVPEPIVPDLTAFGAAIYTAPNAPRVKPELGRHRFSTSLAESNLVGNIYYANYYGWQSQALGRFLHELQSAGGWGGSRGSLSCTFCAVAHLREAMPFDQIEVVMGLRGLYERGLELHFDFYKVREGSQSVKLATGQYQALWIDGVSDRVADLPRDYVAGFTQFSSAAAE